MICPQCNSEYDDYDGIRFLYCSVCNYCIHPSTTNGKCNYCGKHARVLEISKNEERARLSKKTKKRSESTSVSKPVEKSESEKKRNPITKSEPTKRRKPPHPSEPV